MIYSDLHGVDLWDGSSWSNLVPGSSISDIGYHSVGEYQPVADAYVFGGGNNDPKKLYKLDAGGELTVLPSAPFPLGNGSTTQGILVSDPASDRLIAMQRQGEAWAELDPLNETWKSIPISGGNPYLPQYGAPNLPHFKTIAIPIPEYDVIMFVSQYGGMNDDVWLYKHTTDYATVPEAVSTLKLTSDLEGDVPFTVGVGFRKGDVSDSPSINLPNYQVDIKRRWPDGSPWQGKQPRSMFIRMLPGFILRVWSSVTCWRLPPKLRLTWAITGPYSCRICWLIRIVSGCRGRR